MIASCLALSLPLALVLSSTPATESVAEILQGARAARGSSPPAAMYLDGGGSYQGTETEISLEFQREGPFRLEWSGPLGNTVTFDGEELWQVDSRAGVPYPLESLLGDAYLCWVGVWTGLWLEEGFAFGVTLAQSSSAEKPVLTISSPRSSFAANLTLDADSMVPESFRSIGFGGDAICEFGEPLDLDGYLLPGEIFLERQGIPALEIMVYDGEVLEAASKLARPENRPTHVVFDPEVSVSIPVTKGPMGHLMIKPKVNGQDVGWFAFDTGAPVTVIEPWAAEKLDLPVFGAAVQSGAGAEVKETHHRQAESLQIGPITLEKPVLVEMNLGMMLGGNRVGGILGWDVLIQAVVEIDMQTPELLIYRPDQYEMRGGEWHDMVLHALHPHVKASFEGDREGLFRLDTGAGSTNVMFHTPAVDRFQLLEGRTTSPGMAQGAGGLVTLEVGTIDWFEIAGHRTEKPQVRFCRDEKGALADPNSLGNMGGGLLKPFKLAFDYQKRRVGFIRRDASKAP